MSQFSCDTFILHVLVKYNAMVIFVIDHFDQESKLSFLWTFCHQGLPFTLCDY